MLIQGKLRELLNDINYQLITDSKVIYQPIEGTRKEDMLSTIVLSLLAIWLSIMIIGQLVGGVVGYSFYKSITSEKDGK